MGGRGSLEKDEKQTSSRFCMVEYFGEERTQKRESERGDDSSSKEDHRNNWMERME